jgi:hypothetical protein
MMRRFFAFVFGVWAATSLAAAERSNLPITTASGEAADLLREWWKAGEAAGNAGDFYDNRDREHRLLDLKLFPQLTRIQYTSNEIAARLDYAGARMVRTNVVIGNSSTSGGVLESGSNPRSLYLRSLQILYEQYTHNNLYAYPEHQDHDPGHSGPNGYGDLYPINTPYLYASQGSSGSELAFMQAAVHALAAFRPEVKARLIQRGFLAPTIQMLLRRSYKAAPGEADYFTGKAHPSVFESSWIDEAAMVRAAHAITEDTLPPLVQMRVVHEDAPKPKADFGDFVGSEKFADTPCAIGRIFRGIQRTRRMVVSAEMSYDLNLNPLKWRWAVLRGDPSRITITPLNEKGSRVEITVAWQERRPVAPGAEIESNRVDIGCFVSNGYNYSAPGFVCFYFSDAEARTYDESGRALDIGHNAGVASVSITDWRKFLDLCLEGGARAQFLQARVSESQWKIILGCAENYDLLAATARADALDDEAAHRRENESSARMDQIYATNKNTAEIKRASEAHQKIQAERAATLAKVTESRKALQRHLEPARSIVEPLIASWVANASFTFTDRRDLERVFKAAPRASRDEFERGKELLMGYGLLKKSSGFDFAFTPIRKEAGPLDERLTAFERGLAQRLNAAAISLLVLRGAAESEFKENFVEPLLFGRKDWRDVFHYDSAGKRTGWTRYTPGLAPSQFDGNGNWLDGKRARPVNYVPKPDALRKAMKISWAPAD